MPANEKDLKIPTFSDEERKRKFNMLQLSSIILFMGAIAGLIIFIARDDFYLIFAFSFMLMGALTSIILLRFGHILLASWILLLCLLTTLIFIMYIADGIHDMIILIFPISILIASMLFDRRGLIGYSLIVFFSINTYVICELTGIISNRMSHFTSSLDLISVGIIMSISIALSYKMSDNITRSFLRVKQNAQSLSESNIKLQHEMNEREKIELEIKTKVDELERSERASLNIMEDLNETVNTLKIVERKLAEKNRELEEYTYTVSHDLKSPLVTIQGFSDLLAQNYGDKLDDKGRHYIDRINQGSDRLNHLVSDLLELSRAGRKTQSFEMHDFNSILATSLESLQGKISQAGVKVTHPNDFPRIYGDDMRLSQVLNNLIVNAVNYMGEQKNPEIHIGWEDRGKRHAFHIRDNGIGIKEEDMDRIFKIFERASDTAKGTGIGLSIVRKIVETHGGELTVESEFGKGSTFTFTIPKKGAEI